MRTGFVLALLGLAMCNFYIAVAGAVEVDLHTAERIALEQNLNLAAQSFETRSSQARLKGTYGLYDPVASVFLNQGESREQANLDFYGEKTEIKYREVGLGLEQRLPTGATLGAKLIQRREDATPPPPIDPSYDSELIFSLTQPLLRNFGRTVTEQTILFAAQDSQIAIQTLRQTAFSVVSQVRDAFYNVLKFRDTLQYRKKSVALARKVLEENRSRLTVGLLPPVEVLEAEVGLQDRERALLDAERDLQNALDRLAVLLQENWKVTISDQVSLAQVMLEPNIKIGYELALQKRPEYLEGLNNIEKLKLQERISKNNMLPSLDLSAEYAHRGLEDESSGSLHDLEDANLRNWEIGLTLNYPLANREARNEFRKSELQLHAQRARLAELRSTIRLEIREAVRNLKVDNKKIDVTRRGTDLAEEKLRQLLKRKEVGIATTRQILEGEEDLARAQTEHIAALADYNQSVTAYLRATGQLLEHEGIQFIESIDAETERLLWITEAE